VSPQAYAQGDLYGGPLKNEDPPPSDDVAQYTDPNTIKNMATDTDPGRVSGSGEDYLNFQKTLMGAGEKGDLLGFLNKVSADINNAWHSGATPGAQLQMSMLWTSASALSDAASALGSSLHDHGNNNLKPFHDYFAGDGFKSDTTAATVESSGYGGADGQIPVTVSYTPVSDQQALATAQKKLSDHNATIRDTYQAMPVYLTLTLPPGALPAAPGGRPNKPGTPRTGRAASGSPPAGITGPSSGSVSNTPFGTIPGTPPLTPSQISPNPTLPTPPSRLSNVPLGSTPPTVTPPIATPPRMPSRITPPVVVAPVLTPPRSSVPEMPKLPDETPRVPKLPREFGRSTGSIGDAARAPADSQTPAIGTAGNPSPAQNGTFTAEAATGRSAAAGDGMGGEMMPMAPMMGSMGGPGGQGHERKTWLTEDEDIWDAGTEAVPPVIG
jgi:hypothetical protein